MTSETVLPQALRDVFAASDQPEEVFAALLPAICTVLQTDRCFLHLRDPQTRMYQNLCWRRSPDLPDVSTNGWEPESEWEREDPMFAAALRTDPPIFVEDIETASPDILNVNFEREYMGHRALIHAHVVQDGLLWAILQPCIFGHPRQWSQFDRTVIDQVLEALKPLVLRYVKAAEIPVAPPN
jgi:GAF domain-containing protein